MPHPARHLPLNLGMRPTPGVLSCARFILWRFSLTGEVRFLSDHHNPVLYRVVHVKHVLLVDNENTTFNRATDGLQAFTHSWVLLSAANGKEALSLLKQHPVDVLVTKLNMPVMDGLTLLTHLRRRYPHLPVIVQSTTPAPQGDSPLQFEALSVLHQPVSRWQLFNAISRTLAQVNVTQATGVTLAGLLQLFEGERTSCSLLVTSQGRWGRLHFVSGELVNAHAYAQGLDGQGAAYDILGWEDVHVAIEPPGQHEQRRIRVPLRTLLMDLVRLSDAGTRHEQEDRKEQASVSTPAEQKLRVGEERSTTAEHLINTTRAGHPQALRKQRKDGGQERASKAEQLHLKLLKLWQRRCTRD